MAADFTIKFHEWGGASVTVSVDKDLAQWLCRQSVIAKCCVGVLVKRICLDALQDHAAKVGDSTGTRGRGR